MEKLQKKQLAKEYVQTHRQMGVYEIKNNATGKVLIGSSLDLDKIFNRYQFTLNFGVHTNKELQQDWKQFGEGSFSFRILETVKPQEEFLQSGDDLNKYKQEVEQLEQLWLDEIQPYGEKGYNKRQFRRSQ